jgi:CBS domain-containing protein
MVQHDCRAITIIDHGERPLGIVTDRDIIRRVVAEGRNPLAFPAQTCMSRPVVTVSGDLPLEDILATMEKHEIHRVPVVDREGRCIGLINRVDVSAGEQRL